jgi:hypothetical protein
MVISNIGDGGLYLFETLTKQAILFLVWCAVDMVVVASSKAMLWHAIDKAVMRILETQ